MKNIIKAVAFIVGVVLFSCQQNPDLSVLNNYPPAILSISPDGTTKVGNNFDLKVVLVDGPSSPLANVTLTLTDSAGKTTFYTGSKAIVGTKDSIVVSGADFKASTLPLGTYLLTIDAVDKGNNKTDKAVLFKISTNLYASKNKAMYLAGVYNNWGADVMTLVAPFTWQIKNIDLKAGAFKFKNTVDWTDQDWGDPSCSGVVEITTGGGPNTDCKFTGLSNITFNDNTLAYSVTPAVTYARNITNLFLLGSMDNFEGTAYNFTLASDHVWNLASVRMKAGDQFKFSVGAFGGDSFGDSGTPGTAIDQGPNIVLGSTYKDAFYDIQFNDKTLVYTLTVVGYPYPSAMYLIGGATASTWTPSSTTIPFVSTGTGTFEVYAWINTGDGFKYIPQNTGFDNDWGPVPADAGAASGSLEVTGESNATVSVAGFYRITLDFTTNTFTVTQVNFSVVGDATPGGWPASPPAAQSDTDMTYVSGTTWAVDVNLNATGALKFRANHDWGINFGDGGNGKLLFNGSNNIATPGAGNYHVVMDLDPANGYTYKITLN